MRDEAIPNSVPEILTNRTLEKASAFSAAFRTTISKSILSFLYNNVESSRRYLAFDEFDEQPCIDQAIKCFGCVKERAVDI